MRDASACLNGLIAQIAQYPVSFRHNVRLAERVTTAVYIPEADESGGGVTLKPTAVSQKVQRFTRMPFSVWFDGGCPIKMGIGSCGMHFVDVDGRLIYSRGEHE